jgi:hypothetical protein
MTILPSNHPAALPLDLIEGGRNASLPTLPELDAFNRSISDDSNIKLCSTSHLVSGKLRTCDSIYRCVPCSIYRLAERRGELRGALGIAEEVAFLTLTHRRESGHVGREWRAQNEIMSEFTRRSDWSRFKKNHEIDGYAVVTEMTFDEDGWQVHNHMVFTFNSSRSPEAERRLRQAVEARWSDAARTTGHRADSQSQRLRLIPTEERNTIARYMTKQHLMRRSSTPRSFYPADLLQAGMQQGDADAIAEYKAYSMAARGKAFIRRYGKCQPQKVRFVPVEQLEPETRIMKREITSGEFEALLEWTEADYRADERRRAEYAEQLRHEREFFELLIA